MERHTALGLLAAALALSSCGGPGGPSAAGRPPIGSPFVSIAAGQGLSCGITRAGAGYCWGATFSGRSQPDDCGSFACSTTPQALPGGLVLEQIALGTAHACAVAAGGAAYCWGTNHEGELGAAAVGTQGTTSPVPVTGGLLFRSVGAGGSYSCGLTPGTGAYCWGRNIEGQVGDGRGGSYTADARAPVAVAGGGGFQSVSTGTLGSCAIDADGRAFCWGLMIYGFPTQTRCNNADGRGPACNLVPEPVPGNLRFRVVATGNLHACALTEDGAAYCWGGNGSGELGNGTTITPVGPRPPVRVLGGLVFRSIDCGDQFTCGLTADGTAYCWGLNGFGVLGNGSLVQSSVPVPVAGGHRFQSISTGDWHACAVTTDGLAYCWGRNDYAQLGDGTVSDFRSVPTLVAGQQPGG